jgi:methionyl-tRNA formyltransferase
MSLRVAFIGCVESSRVALRSLLDMPTDLAQVVGVVTRRHSNFNADFTDISPLLSGRDVPLLHVEDAPSDAQQADWLRSVRPDLVFCIGWSHLLGNQVMQVAPHGVIGFHPAALPANRGRHPLIWALVLGLHETASSFFMIESEADSGALLSQVPIDIADDDDAATLYAKVLAVIPSQMHDIVRGLADGTLRPRVQDASQANHWRKRSAKDGMVDWRMGADSIFNLVRALARPYPGAEFVHDGASVKLWRCTPIDGGPANIEPGKVLGVAGREVTVKCGVGAVRLVEHEMQRIPEQGEYL